MVIVPFWLSIDDLYFQWTAMLVHGATYYLSINHKKFQTENMTQKKVHTNQYLSVCQSRALI